MRESARLTSQLSSTLTSFDRRMRVERTSRANSRFSTLIYSHPRSTRPLYKLRAEHKQTWLSSVDSIRDIFQYISLCSKHGLNILQ